MHVWPVNRRGGTGTRHRRGASDSGATESSTKKESSRSAEDRFLPDGHGEFEVACFTVFLLHAGMLESILRSPDGPRQLGRVASSSGDARARSSFHSCFIGFRKKTLQMIMEVSFLVFAVPVCETQDKKHAITIVAI